MANKTITPIEILQDGSFAIGSDCYTHNFVLAADAAENVTVPTFTGQSGATGQSQYAFISSNADLWVRPLTSAENVTIVNNGTFAASTGWTLGSGWAVGSGTLNGTATSADAEYTPDVGITLQANVPYRCVFTTSGISGGTVTLSVGGTAGTARATNATFTETIIAGATSTVKFTGAAFTGSVDNFTITPIAAVPTTDISNGYGIILNPTQLHVGRVSTLSLVSAATCKGSITFFRS